jgi:hypothetical protein
VIVLRTHPSVRRSAVITSISYIYREGINRLPPNLACLLLEMKKRTQGSKNSGKSVISSISGVGRLWLLDEAHRRWRQAQNCFEEVSKTNTRSPKNVLGSISGAKGLCSSKVNAIGERRQRKICSTRRGDYRNRSKLENSSGFDTWCCGQTDDER